MHYLRICNPAINYCWVFSSALKKSIGMHTGIPTVVKALNESTSAIHELILELGQRPKN